eukprot:3696366-Pyramimonas_sp.AAC.1
MRNRSPGMGRDLWGPRIEKIATSDLWVGACWAARLARGLAAAGAGPRRAARRRGAPPRPAVPRRGARLRRAGP